MKSHQNSDPTSGGDWDSWQTIFSQTSLKGLYEGCNQLGLRTEARDHILHATFAFVVSYPDTLPEGVYKAARMCERLMLRPPKSNDQIANCRRKAAQLVLGQDEAGWETIFRRAPMRMDWLGSIWISFQGAFEVAERGTEADYYHAARSFGAIISRRNVKGAPYPKSENGKLTNPKEKRLTNPKRRKGSRPRRHSGLMTWLGVLYDNWPKEEHTTLICDGVHYTGELVEFAVYALNLIKPNLGDQRFELLPLGILKERVEDPKDIEVEMDKIGRVLKDVIYLREKAEKWKAKERKWYGDKFDPVEGDQ